MNYVIIFAGGIGSRMGSKKPKQFMEVDNKPIIIHTIEKFDSHPQIDGIVVVCKEEYIEYCKNLMLSFQMKKVKDVIPGGNNGQQSIYFGLKYIAQNIKTSENDIVLIHDGVRPVITSELICQSIECVNLNGNSIAVSKAIETVIKITPDGRLDEPIDRSLCRNAKAPQCFKFNQIWHVHNKAIKDGNTEMIDSATLMSYYGYELHVTECSPENIKITTPNDFYMFKALYDNTK